MNDQIAVILGARGFIGQALIRSFRRAQRPVIGVSREKIGTLITPKELLTRFVSPAQKIHTLIVATRTNKSSSPSEDPLNVLSHLCPYVDRLINFSSYAQFYNVPEDSSHTDYLETKRRMSEFLQTTDYSVKSVDMALYTAIGEGDHPNSFLSAAIRSMKHNQELQASPGEQLVSFTDVRDIISAVFRLESEWFAKAGNQYSFWPNPPQQLREIVRGMNDWFPQNQLRVSWGARDYVGHELMDYDARQFPQQLFSDFEWTPLKSTLERLL
jgi:nucleoside-diphosphate-sugar epimerase